MKTIEKIKSILNHNGITVYDYEEENLLCGYELSCYTNQGVNLIIFLDFRDGGKDANNPNDFIEEFKSYMNDFDIDETIEMNRQDKSYVANFTIKKSLEDFEEFEKTILNVIKQIEN